MTTDGLQIPVSTPGADQSLAALLRIANAVEGVGQKAEKASTESSKLSSAFDAIGTAAQHFNSIRAAVGGFVEGLAGAASHVAALSDEQERLSAMSARLGLDFDEGATAAGRFVDETSAMGSASQFAARGIRLSQTEMNDLMRVAGATAQTLGTDVAGEVDRLTEGLLRGKAEGLAPFGGSLVETAGHSHTVAERLAALHGRAGEVETATDNATTSMERFRDTMEDGQRVAAHAFVQELARLQEVGTGLRGANTDAEEFNSSLRGAGQTAAWMVTRVVLGVGIIGGSIATVIGGLTGMVQLAEAATHGLAAFRAERNRLATDGLAAESWNFVRSAANRLEALSDDPDRQRTSMDPRDVPAEAPAPSAAAAAADRTGRNRRGGSNTAHRVADMTFTAEQRDADLAQSVDRLAGIDRAAQAEAQSRATIDGLLREEQTRQDVAAMAQASADKERTRADEERQTLHDRLEAHTTFSGRMADLYDQQAGFAQRMAEGVRGALDAVGNSIKDNAKAWAEGRVSMGDAARGIASDALGAIADLAYGEAAFYAAKSLGLFATGNIPGGFLAAGASVGMLAVGAAFSAGSAVVAPSTPAGGSAAGGGRAASVSTPAPSNNSQNSAPIINNYYAPVFGGREGTEGEVGQRIDRYRDTSARLRRDRP